MEMIIPGGSYPDCKAFNPDSKAVCVGVLLPRVEPVVVNTKEGKKEIKQVVPQTHVFYWKCSQCGRSV